MKKTSIYLSLLPALFAVISSTQAQPPDATTIKLAENTREELFGMLRLMGARAWRFDLCALSDTEYLFKSFIDEYVDGERVKESEFNINVTNWRKRFPDPDDWRKFLARKNPRLSADGEKYLAFEDMGVYIAPKNDSTMITHIDFYGGGALSSPLKLRPLKNTEDNPRYSYDYRPFKIEPFKFGKQRIPLLFVGSFWWDERFEVHRFCTENEFEPDLSNEDIKLIPHYYVIGVEVEEIK